MREHERLRGAMEDRARRLSETVTQREQEIQGMNAQFEKSFEQLDVGVLERDVTDRLKQLNDKLTHTLVTNAWSPIAATGTLTAVLDAP